MGLIDKSEKEQLEIPKTREDSLGSKIYFYL